MQSFLIMCFWRPWGTVIRSQELVPKDAKWSSFHFLLQLQLPSTKKHCICPVHLLLLQRQTVPQAAPSWGHQTHLWHNGTTKVPNLDQVLCWGGKAFPTSPWATHCYLLPQSIQCPGLIFLKFTLESRSLCFQSLEWLPKTCSMKIKPLASLYDSHSESGRDSSLELTLSSWEHLRASHVTASPLTWSWFPGTQAVLLPQMSPPIKPTCLTNAHFFNT